MWTASSDAARQACGKAAARWGNAQAVTVSLECREYRHLSHGSASGCVEPESVARVLSVNTIRDSRAQLGSLRVRRLGVPGSHGRRERHPSQSQPSTSPSDWTIWTPSRLERRHPSRSPSHGQPQSRVEPWRPAASEPLVNLKIRRGLTVGLRLTRDSDSDRRDSRTRHWHWQGAAASSSVTEASRSKKHNFKFVEALFSGTGRIGAIRVTCLEVQVAGRLVLAASHLSLGGAGRHAAASASASQWLAWPIGMLPLRVPLHLLLSLLPRPPATLACE
jgi:hypothetical protein